MEDRLYQIVTGKYDQILPSLTKEFPNLINDSQFMGIINEKDNLLQNLIYYGYMPNRYHELDIENRIGLFIRNKNEKLIQSIYDDLDEKAVDRICQNALNKDRSNSTLIRYAVYTKDYNLLWYILSTHGFIIQGSKNLELYKSMRNILLDTNEENHIRLLEIIYIYLNTIYESSYEVLKNFLSSAEDKSMKFILDFYRVKLRMSPEDVFDLYASKGRSETIFNLFLGNVNPNHIISYSGNNIRLKEWISKTFINDI